MINKISDTNAEMTLTQIFEGESSILFDPPLKLDIYLVEVFKYVNVNFDFGLSRDFDLSPFYIKDSPPEDWVSRAKRIVEFELFHSFFHCPEDPNYSTLNWALFGNLAHRVICRENVGIEVDEIESWKYDKNLWKAYL